jgi:dolichol kinase
LQDDSSDPKISPAGLGREVFRKSIHIIGFVVILMAMEFGVLTTALFITAVSALYCISEYLRLSERAFPFFTSITNLATRTGHSSERSNRFIIAPIYFAAGIVASLVVFPPPASYAAIAAVTLGDGVAAVVGRVVGRTRIPLLKGKTLEGTATGFVCAFAGSLLFTSPAVAAAAAGAGMLVEALPLRISDNLTVPLFAGSAALLIAILLG